MVRKSLAFLISFLGCAVLLARPAASAETGDSSGAWEKGIVTDRRVIYTDKPDCISEIQIDVPSAGRYQLVAYVHHNWRISVPCIYAEAEDAKGIKHKGYHKIENIWYLKADDPGRWFFVSLAEGSFWDLPRGKMRVKFWAEANKAAWDNTVVPPEGNISIANFFLIPVLNSESEIFLPGLINPEAGHGDWNVYPYLARYATNLIETNKKNSQFTCDLDVPVAGYYQFWFCLLSPLDNNLEIRLKNEKDKYKTNIKLRGKSEWVLIPTEQIYLNRGGYSLTLENLFPHKVALDFFMVLPVSVTAESSKPDTAHRIEEKYDLL